MQLRFDSEADVIFLALRAAEGGEAGGKRLDEARVAHLDRAGRVFAYEFPAGQSRCFTHGNRHGRRRPNPRSNQAGHSARGRDAVGDGFGELASRRSVGDMEG